MPFLDWVNKNHAVTASQAVPYHLLQLEQSFGDVQAAQDNLLIQGDNLQALKALLPFYTNKVKCIFIDPPYNTGSAFEHYDDKLEHSQWLTMMYPRLVLLRELLADDGFFVVHLDDAESHYMKVMMDEVLGRANYHASIYIQVRYTDKTLKSAMAYHKQVEQALVYGKSPLSKPNRPQLKLEGFEKFEYQVIEKGEGKTIELNGKPVIMFADSEYEIVKVAGNVDGLKEIWASGSILDGNSSGRFFRDYLTGRHELDGLGVLYKVPNIGDDGLGCRYFTGPKKQGATKGKYYQGVPLGKRDLLEQVLDQPIENFYDLSGAFGNCRMEGDVSFRSGKKPEQYLNSMLEFFTSKNDLILDSFLGSGTTAAVAHKMKRRYIGIEMGEHAKTHCIPRLQKVIEGEQGGISKAVNWQGGGGFSFYTLGDAVFDANGHISASVRFHALAAYIWLLETKTATVTQPHTPFIGEHEGVAYYLLYNGILGDRRPNGGNVLTNPILAHLNTVHPHTGKKIVFGEACRIGDEKLASLDVVFKQIPYELHQRV
ncbi:MAG: site-specific DNA-methyltransferase [Methylotenera sp.]|nr:site-specific DNA-methyltransferase [Methylotenera sp.]